MLNHEDIAAEACAWACDSGVLDDWVVRGSEEEDERRLRKLARKSVWFRMMEAKRGYAEPERRFLLFYLGNTEDGEPWFEVADDPDGGPAGSSSTDARLRKEAPEITEMMRAEQREALRERWAQIRADLPPGVADAAELVWCMDLSMKAAAKALGVSPSTVRMRLERHRGRIARQLGDDFLDK